MKLNLMSKSNTKDRFWSKFLEKYSVIPFSYISTWTSQSYFLVAVDLSLSYPGLWRSCLENRFPFPESIALIIIDVLITPRFNF